MTTAFTYRFTAPDLSQFDAAYQPALRKSVDRAIGSHARDLVRELKRRVPRRKKSDAQTAKYGKLWKSLVATSRPSKGAYRKTYLSRWVINRKDAYWWNFLLGGTRLRQTQKGYNRGQIEARGELRMEEWRAERMRSWLDEAVREALKFAERRTGKIVVGGKNG